MDTGTHLVIGLGLAGLAHIDPVIAADSTAATAVLIGTVVGQQAPDLDGLLRFRGNAVYIRNHRGASHSLPALPLWALLITLFLTLGFGARELPLWNVGFWVFLAVVVHVFVDCFNTYGTQAFRPFTERWVSWNIIHIFDPVIFVTHLAAIFTWAAGMAPPEIIFPVLYGLLVLYYVWRTLYHFLLVRSLPGKDADHRRGDKYLIIPTVNLYVWHILKKHQDGSFALGELKKGTIKWVDKASCDEHPAVEASKSHPDIAAFLYFSSYACAELHKHSWGYEVRWADVRYRHRKQYPFVAALLMDHEFRPIDSYVGWLSEAKLRKKLHGVYE